MSDEARETAAVGGQAQAGDSLATARVLAVAATLVHLALIAACGRLRWDYLVLDGLLAAFALGGARTAALLRAGLPLWITVVLYLDVQGLLLPLRGTILTGDLFRLDAALFPAPGEAPLPWPAWFATRTHVVADVLASLAYGLFVVPFFGALFVYVFVEPERARAMAWSFFAANLLAICCFVLLPAAPPWYVLAYGPGPADLAIAPSPAGTARFDALFGVELFSDVYSRNPNVFAAIPSLHAAYPLMATWHLWGRGRGWRVFGVGFTVWVVLSALYLSHHYVVDLLAGLATGLVSCAVVAWLRNRPQGSAARVARSEARG